MKEVIGDSIAAEMGIEPGDKIISINGKEINDILDYKFLIQEDSLLVEVDKADGELWNIEIEKDYDEKMGIIFAGLIFDRLRTCKNRCIFCFIDQLPANMRETLYVKDDDYRYSFLFGNFITLTNLKEAEWQKIADMRLSPLYVSVHCIDSETRVKMLKNPAAANIKGDLQRLKAAGIQVHTQIVLCPGINDGEILFDTIAQLSDYYPSVSSIGIVPVGLTGHRSKLPHIRQFSASEAREIIEMVDSYQKLFRRELGSGLVYLADEFYLKADCEYPHRSYYDDYPQIENGIGISRILLDDFEEYLPSLPIQTNNNEVYIITGILGLPVINRIAERLNAIKGLKIGIIPIKNKFFGGNVTVTGLLTGKDIIEQLGDKYMGKKVILPDVVLKEGQEILLDGISLEQITEATKAEIRVAFCNAESLIDCIFV